jgi:hypothetical protein
MKWCTREVAVAVDTEQGGRTEWSMELFKGAAVGIEGSNEELIRECDGLLGGHFSRRWAELNGGNVNAPLCLPNPPTVHLGTYVDETGKTKDIRNIGYLQMLEASPNDLSVVARATTAMLPGSCTDLTLSDRRRALKGWGNVDITGLALRVYLSPNFIPALALASEDAKIVIMSDDMVSYDAGAQRAGMSTNMGTVVGQANLYRSTYGGVPIGSPVEPQFFSPTRYFR